MMPARIFYGNMVYTGTVTDLSENGMFINTEVNFPVDSAFDTVVLQSGHAVMIPVRVKRTAASSAGDSANDGIGVKVVTPPRDYLEILCRCEAPDTGADS